MTYSNQTSCVCVGFEDGVGILYGDRSVPTAADMLAFIHSTMDPAVGKWLTSVIPFAVHIPAFSGNILEVHFDKFKNNVDFAARLNTTFDKKLIAYLKKQEYSFPCLGDGLDLLIKPCGSGFNYGVENIWVEYDAPFNGTPALFFDINRNKPFHPHSAFGYLKNITDALGYPANTALLKFLERIGQARLGVVYYGLMFSRNSHSVRLIIHGMDACGLEHALRCLDWKGNYEVLKMINATCFTKKQKLIVGVDFGTRLEPRIGIEVFDENPTAFIQKLCNNRYIHEDHLRWLKAWEGSCTLPDHLSTALTNLHQRTISKLDTRINHFKFVVDDTDLVKAKGYLYYCF